LAIWGNSIKRNTIKMVKGIGIFGCLLLCCLQIQAQVFHRKNDEDWLLILSPGISYQGQWFGEVNLMRAKITGAGPCSAPVIGGARLGVEFNFDRHHFVYAPKLGFEVSTMLISLRGNAIAYIDDGKTDLRLLPEIGLSLLGLANLNYGYGAPLLKFEATAATRHRISLTVNLDFDLFEKF
jgi:hypothetical protein